MQKPTTQATMVAQPLLHHTLGLVPRLKSRAVQLYCGSCKRNSIYTYIS